MRDLTEFFQGIALRKEFYPPYYVKKTKNFGTTELENKPKWL